MATTPAVLNRLFPVGKIRINEVPDQNTSICNLPRGFEPTDCEVLVRNETRVSPGRRTFYLVHADDMLVYLCVYGTTDSATNAMVFGIAKKGTTAGDELAANLKSAIPSGTLQ